MRLTCPECKGTGEVVWTKERGGPKCNKCWGHGHLTREAFVGCVASLLDMPSVYMGGASQQSRKRAERIADYLAGFGLEL